MQKQSASKSVVRLFRERENGGAALVWLDHFHINHLHQPHSPDLLTPPPTQGCITVVYFGLENCHTPSNDNKLHGTGAFMKGWANNGGEFYIINKLKSLVV
jgi:hypothetical protein